MHASTIYHPNTSLSLLDKDNSSSLRYGDFGIIWGIYKPHHLPTTVGSQWSLIDELITTYNQHPIVQQAITKFGINEELGMLTRLDNETAGMVWFARNKDIKHQWLEDQASGHITKIYEADVLGWIKKSAIVETPIMHHRYDDTKMIIIAKQTDITKGRGRIHHVGTLLNPIMIEGNITHIQALIHQGCRHQIRIHSSSSGTPIMGEQIYHKDKISSTLHLRSVGINRNKLINPIIIDYAIYST